MIRITRVETVALQVPLTRDFRGSVYGVSQKNAIITRIHTDHGPVGQCVNGEGEAGLQPQIVSVIEKELAPLIAGKDPSGIEALWWAMWNATDRGGRDKRAAVRAVACVDSALWDLQGKVFGQPLFRIWGGCRDRLPIIAIGGQYVDGHEPSDYGREMEEFRSLGLVGCKFKVGGRSPEEDALRTEAARAAGGPDFVLCVDANRGWTRPDAVAYARRCTDLGLRWFEEPCKWHNDRRDMAVVRAVAGLPITAGQSEATAEACRDLMVDRAIDVCNLDASWGGGPSAWLRVAKMAACFGVEMAHHGEPVLGSHLVAAVGNGTYVETHHPQRDPIFHQMVQGRGDVIDGEYRLPTAPGWGVEFDEEFIGRYRVA
jgi:D-arabinonate dehydratase